MPEYHMQEKRYRTHFEFYSCGCVEIGVVNVLSHIELTRLALAVSALAAQMCWSTVVPDGSKRDALQNNNKLIEIESFNWF